MGTDPYRNCQRPPRALNWRPQVWPWCFRHGIVNALLFLSLVGIGEALTKQGDIDGLLGIKSQIQNQDIDFLESWLPDTDPCEDNWRGVICNCTTAEREVDADLECPPIGPRPPQESRVIALKLGCKQCTSDAERLNGTIADDVRKLEELRFLDLSKNNLIDILPLGIQELKELRFLSVSDNKLSGTLPDFIGGLSHLQILQIDRNEFSGSIPEAWCTENFNVTTVVLDHNYLLCGTVPHCLQSDMDNDKIPSVEMTHLRRSTKDKLYVCDDTPPVCDEAKGCGVFVPDYWTDLHKITFHFHNFTDPQSQGISYFFKLTEESGDVAIDATLVEHVEGLQVTNQLMQRKEDNLTANRVTVEYNLTVFNLIPGSTYNVTVIAENTAGPPLSSQVTSPPVRVDSTGPKGGDFSINEEESMPQQPGRIQFQWKEFVDKESNITSLSLQVVKRDEEGNVVNVTDPQTLAPNENNSTIELELEPNVPYRAELRAVNEAGISTISTTREFRLGPEKKKGGGFSTTMMVVVVIVCVFAACIPMSLVIVGVDRAKSPNTEDDSYEIVKEFLDSLLDVRSEPPKPRPEVMGDHQERAFVVTDLEGSTNISNCSENGFKTMIGIHDEIMRAGIAAHKGYEINTEGDAFLVAFSSVVDAVQFCMEIQYNLLDFDWPKEVLQMEKCKVEKTKPEGHTTFRGPRVRMAIHWDDKVVHKSHPSTKTIVFEGPGLEFAKELVDAAHGGQVLLTHQTWLKLQNNMGIAGFPSVEQIGEFVGKRWSSFGESSMWLYQITHLVGRPLYRTFPKPRDLEMMRKGWEFSIVPPPEITSQKMPLAFVALRMVFPDGLEEFPPELCGFLEQIIRTVAQQFKGYIYSSEWRRGRALLAFLRIQDAVRYSHSLQVVMLHTDWPNVFERYSGPTEYESNGQPLFFGPRIAVAVHVSKHYTVHQKGEGLPDQDDWVEYGGHGQVFLKKLSKLVNGGQVVLSEAAWGALQSKFPGQTQVISLGRHFMHSDDKYSHLLMEVLPEILKSREFDELATAKKESPGYRDSPCVTKNVAIVFAKAVKPKDVVSIERRKESQSVVDERHARQVLLAYITSVNIYSNLVRKWLPAYRGYECKEPEAGKFTLAFSNVDDAIRWCARIQLELLKQDWPEGLLEMEGCKEVKANTGELLQLGLRAKMGMAYGIPKWKQPLSSGQADYFGNVPNLAARVCGLAAPGQVLAECSPGFGDAVTWITEGSVGIINFEEGGPIELKGLGFYLLKGFDDDPKLVYQASPISLVKREYEMDPAAIRVADAGRPLSLIQTKFFRQSIRKRDRISRFHDRWLASIAGHLIAWLPMGKRHVGSSSSKMDVSSTLAGSSQQLLYSPKHHHSGSPYGLSHFGLPKFSMSGTAYLPSAGPSQTFLEENSVASHGSWGDSLYYTQPRSGSGLSSVSRGPSSIYQQNHDASSSPPPDASPFSNPSEHVIDDEEPGTSLSFRPRGRDKVLSFGNNVDGNFDFMQGNGLVARDSNESGASVKSQSSYIQELAELWVPNIRERRSESAFEFRPTGVEQSHPGSPILNEDDVDREDLCRQDSRSFSAPEFLCREWWGNIAEEDNEMGRAHSLHLSRQPSKILNQVSIVIDMDPSEVNGGDSNQNIDV